MPKLSKNELRAQVETLEWTVATLRARSRDDNRTAKVAAARISELEAQVAQFKQDAAPQPAVPQWGAKPKLIGTKRTGRSIDPGDAVPPGVAVQEPAPLDEEV